MRNLILACLLLVPTAALAIPSAGETLPSIKAPDVTEAPRDLQALLAQSKELTLVVAITDRDAGDEMRAWYEKADEMAKESNRISIISINVPFYVSDEYARSKARAQVPPRWESQTLMDTDEKMAKMLGMKESKTPYVFVVNPQGKVLASVHAKAGSPEAAQIWQALKGG